jgi:hypothetical protein
MQTSLALSLALQLNKKAYVRLEEMEALKKKKQQTENRSWGQKLRHYKPTNPKK